MVLEDRFCRAGRVELERECGGAVVKVSMGRCSTCKGSGDDVEEGLIRGLDCGVE